MTRERAVQSNGMSSAHAPGRVSVTDVRQLIALMNASDIEEITLEHEAAGLRLTLRKPAPAALVASSADSAFAGDALAPLAEESAAIQPEGEAVPADPDANLVEICAPLVGRFRSAMSRDGSALVAENALVKPGQVVAAVEALNVLNEVEASVAGRVREILAQDGDFVEYGKPLLRIEPTAEPS
jgi:acetyl-CoA carboxylase biotin carboxyl carrier protein